MGRSKRRAARGALVLALGAAASSLVVGCGNGESAGTPTLSQPLATTTEPRKNPARYALGPTRSCLEERGAAVSPIRPADPQLRALRDLAQRTSLEVRFRGETVGLAFGDAKLLAELLRVPDDPYLVDVRRNAVLMYRPSARAEARVVQSCLRPSR